MLAIHHIKSIKAIPGHTEASNYITLEFTGQDLEGPLAAEVVLYFDNPLAGTLWVLAEGINAAMAKATTVAVQEDPRPTYEIGYEQLNKDIPF